MTKREVIEMLTAKAECIRRESSGIDVDCNFRNCDECDLCYKQGTMEDQMEALGVAISALQAQDLQPTCNNLATDCISRQAAIDAMESVDWYHINKKGQLTHGANSREDEPLYKAKDVYKVLNDMPSAQSDSCNGCKWENAFGYGECDHCKRRYDDMYEVKDDE